MTGLEYIQLKAFARIDGALLAALLVTCFVFYIMGLRQPGFGIASMLTIAVTPLLVGWRLKRFRDGGLDGIISFKRGWGYVILVFFYGGLLFALAQYAYFAYLDHGYMFNALAEMMAMPENSEMLKQLGMTEQVGEGLSLIRSQRPIDLSISAFTSLLMVGAFLGLPIAAILQRSSATPPAQKNNQ